jgi:hypothetical protein
MMPPPTMIAFMGADTRRGLGRRQGGATALAKFEILGVDEADVFTTEAK